MTPADSRCIAEKAEPCGAEPWEFSPAFAVDPRACHVGQNRVEVRRLRRGDTAGAVVLEKLEVHVAYR